jgi:Lrp/AsnC family transcriptional regulator for asnA, asnC and gidA
MAKENNTSVTAIRSRYLNLKKAGVINGSILQVNLDVLGFSCYGFIEIEADKKNVSAVRDYLQKCPCILSTWSDTQRHIIANCFATPDLNCFRDLLSDLKSNPLIKSFQSELYEGFAFNEHPENLIIPTGRKVELESKGKEVDLPDREWAVNRSVKTGSIQIPDLKQIDKIDFEIAKRLSYNSRTPFSHIAKELNMSTAYVIERYNRLKESGFFIRSSITVNMEKLGYPAFAAIYLRTGGTKIMDTHNQIFEIPNVIVLTKVIGEWDLFVVIPLASFKDLFRVEKEFEKIHGVEKVQIKVIPSQPRWPPDLSVALIGAKSNNNK